MTKKFYQKKEFKDLQTEWYQKLKQKGFDDIEWYSPKSGYGQNSGKLKGSGQSLWVKSQYMTKDQIKEEANFLFEHFQSVRNFLTHTTFLPKIDYLLLEMYEKGYTIRKICHEMDKLVCLYPPQRARKNNKKVKSGLLKLGEPNPGFTTFYVCQKLKHLRELILHWNLDHPKGLYNDGELNEQ